MNIHRRIAAIRRLLRRVFYRTASLRSDLDAARMAGITLKARVDQIEDTLRDPLQGHP